jgi:hypothetical protein
MRTIAGGYRCDRIDALHVIRVKSQVTHRVVFSADGTRLVTSDWRVVRVYAARPPPDPAAAPLAGRK